MTQEDMRALDIGVTTAVATMVEAMGMAAENQQRTVEGKSLAYDEKAFLDLLSRTDCFSSAAILRWQR